MSMFDGYSKAGLIFGNSGGGGGGTTDYTQLTNKPKINGTTVVGELDADDLGLANSYIYKLVMDEDNNRNYFIDGEGEEIDTADVYSSMIEMALASNALGIINLTFAGLENTNLARLYYTSIDIESDAQGLLFSARENNVLMCAKVERDDVEVIIRNVSDVQNYITPEQYGAVGDGVTDDSLAFEEMLDDLSTGDTVMCAKKYNISSALRIRYKHYITFIMDGAIFYIPSVEPENAHAVFTLTDCTNVSIIGGTFITTRDKEEISISTGSAVRHTNTGSNITFFFIARCSNLKWQGQKFEGAKFDIRSLEEASTSGVNSHIMITDIISTNASVSLDLSAITDGVITSVDIKPADKLGLCEHSIYLSKKCVNIAISNFVLNQDGYCGTAILVNSDNDSHDITISNGLINALEGVAVTKSTAVSINDITFNGVAHGIENLSNGTKLSVWDEFFVRTYYGGDVVIDSSVINCLKQNIKTQYSNENPGSCSITFNNCKINCADYNLRTINTAIEEQDDICLFVKFNGCEILTNLLAYIAADNSIDIQFNSCNIICNTDGTYNYAFSIRDIRTKIKLNYCSIKIGNSLPHTLNNNLYYNLELDCPVELTFCGILGYDKITHITAPVTKRVMNSVYFNYQEIHQIFTIKLYADSWVGKTQVVNIGTIKEDSLVQVSPIPSNVDAYAKAKIICTAQGDGTLTFTCDSVPASDLTVTVVNWG